MASRGQGDEITVLVLVGAWGGEETALGLEVMAWRRGGRPHTVAEEGAPMSSREDGYAQWRRRGAGIIEGGCMAARGGEGRAPVSSGEDGRA
jgi:hypothetical protein